MTKTQACKIIDFIRNHYDSVGQEEWFDLCELLFEVVEHDANQQGFAGSLLVKYPYFFEIKEG